MWRIALNHLALAHQKIPEQLPPVRCRIEWKERKEQSVAGALRGCQKQVIGYRAQVTVKEPVP